MIGPGFELSLQVLFSFISQQGTVLNSNLVLFTEQGGGERRKDFTPSLQ